MNQIIFVMDGNYKVGFEVNKNEYYKLKITRASRGTVIGAFECFFDKRSVICYKTTNERDLTGYFIRKHNWKSLENDFSDFMLTIKK